MKSSLKTGVTSSILVVTAIVLVSQNCSLTAFESAEPDASLVDTIPPEAMQIDDMIVRREMVAVMTPDQIAKDFETRGSVKSSSQDEASGSVELQKAQEGVKSVDTDLWPNGVISYRFHSTAPYTPTKAQKDRFKAACKELGTWAKVSCVEVPADTTKHHVLVMNVDDPNICGSSYLGFFKSNSMKFPSGTTYQKFKMNPKCWFADESTVSHELLHAFGMMHEQQHFNAPNKLTVNWSSIDEAYADNFIPLTKSEQAAKSSGFNYQSILMYHSLGFSTDGSYTMLKKGLEATDPAAVIHRNTRVSLQDHQMLMNMYGVKSGVTTTTLTQTMYNSVYADRVYSVERDCSSREGFWDDCFGVPAGNRLVSVEKLSSNDLCVSDTTDVTYRFDANYFQVANGCSGKFRIKYTGYSFLLWTAFREDQPF